MTTTSMDRVIAEAVLEAPAKLKDSLATIKSTTIKDTLSGTILDLIGCVTALHSMGTMYWDVTRGDIQGAIYFSGKTHTAISKMVDYYRFTTANIVAASHNKTAPPDYNHRPDRIVSFVMDSDIAFYGFESAGNDISCFVAREPHRGASVVLRSPGETHIMYLGDTSLMVYRIEDPNKDERGMPVAHCAVYPQDPSNNVRHINGWLVTKHTDSNKLRIVDEITSDVVPLLASVAGDLDGAFNNQYRVIVGANRFMEIDNLSGEEKAETIAKLRLRGDLK